MSLEGHLHLQSLVQKTHQDDLRRGLSAGVATPANAPGPAAAARAAKHCGAGVWQSAAPLRPAPDERARLSRCPQDHAAHGRRL